MLVMSEAELQLLRDSSYILTCFSEGYFSDAKPSLTELIGSMEMPELENSPLIRFHDELQSVNKGIRSNDEVRRAAVQTYCQINHRMWQIVMDREAYAARANRPSAASPDVPQPIHVRIWRALDNPKLLLSALWLAAAFSVAVYEVNTLRYKSSGWLFYFPEYGPGYPRAIGWAFVAAVLAIIWISLSGKLKGVAATPHRIALAIAAAVAVAIPAWMLIAPKTKADCYLAHIKAGMSDRAVREVRWACDAKYP